MALLAALQRGRLCLQNQEYEAALTAYREAYQLDPANRDTKRGLGTSLRMLGRLTEALDHYTKADPLGQDDSIQRGWAHTLLQLERYADAAQRYEHALQLNDTTDSALWGLAEALRCQGKHKEAIPTYERALSLNPRNELAYEAAENAKQAMQLQQQSDSATGPASSSGAEPILADCLRMQGHFEEASTHYRRLLERPGALPAPVAALYRRGLGDCLRALGRAAEAQEHLLKATELEPQSDHAWVMLGDCQLQLGKFTEALTSFTEATRLNPQRASAWTGMGDAHRMMSHYSEALDAFAKSIQVCGEEAATNLAPQAADAHSRWGWTLRMQRREEEAMKHFTEALRLVPGHAFAQRGVDEAPAPRKSSFLSRLRLSDRSESTPTDSTVVRPPQPREAFVSVAPDPGAPEDTTTVQAFEVLPRAPPPPAALIVPAPAGLADVPPPAAPPGATAPPPAAATLTPASAITMSSTTAVDPIVPPAPPTSPAPRMPRPTPIRGVGALSPTSKLPGSAQR